MATISSILLLFLLTTISVSNSAKTDPGNKPTFTEEPTDPSNVIAKSTVLKCKVRNGLNAWFDCSEDERTIDRKYSSSNYVDPSDGVRHIELQLELRRRYPEYSSPSAASSSSPPVMTDLVVQCWCSAYGAHQTIESRRATLQFAYVPEPEVEPEPETPKPVDGGWSHWSPWSTCSHECQQVKRRSCSHPSPKYGGQHCFGADFHARNCTGGMCRKLDLYHQKREREDSKTTSTSSSSSGSRTSERDAYLLAVVFLTTFLLLFIIVLLVLLRRRNQLRKSTPSFIDARREDGHSIRLLLQQQQSLNGMHLHQPDLIRGGVATAAGDKIQLISRLNNFDSNIVEHLVIRNEHLMSNQGTLMSNQGTLEKQSLHDRKNLVPGSAANLINNNHRTHGSSASVNALVTPLHQRQQHHHYQQQHGMLPCSSPSNEQQTDSFSEGAGSEPDYAEPVINSSSASSTGFTPERRPPLPKSSPPNQRQPSSSRTRSKPTIEVLPSTKMPATRSANRPPQDNRCKNSVDSSSLSS